MMTYHSTTIGCPSRFRAEENCKEENMECGPAVDRKNVRLTKTHIASIAKCMVLRHPRNTESRMHPPQHPKQMLLPVFFFVVGLACAIYLFAFNPIHACTVTTVATSNHLHIHTRCRNNLDLPIESPVSVVEEKQCPIFIFLFSH